MNFMGRVLRNTFVFLTNTFTDKLLILGRASSVLVGTHITRTWSLGAVCCYGNNSLPGPDRLSLS